MATALEYESFLDAFAAMGRTESARLVDVLERLDDGQCDSVALVFSTQALILKANGDNDTIVVATVPANEPLSGFRPSLDPTWARLRGKEFGWGWVTVNQQGYCDGVLLSFETLEPCVLINVIASSLKTQPIGTGAGRPEGTLRDTIPAESSQQPKPSVRR